jgi:type II secretory pathway pseudopilin PulG
MRNREGSGDEGETLVELLVSIALLGIASIAIMASITMGLKASALSAGLAQNQNLLRNWAEVLNATPYIDCATASSYGVPIGMNVPSNVDLVVTEVAYWDEGTSSFIGSCSTDEGAQRLTLQTTVESGTNQPSVNELKIVIRKPCVSGC